MESNQSSKLGWYPVALCYHWSRVLHFSTVLSGGVFGFETEFLPRCNFRSDRRFNCKRDE